MKGQDIIFTGLQSWDIPFGSNAVDLAKQMAKQNRVLYVNSPLDHMTILRNRKTQELTPRLDVLKGTRPNLRQVSDTLWVLDFPFSVWSVNGLPDGAIFDFFNRRNNRRMFHFIKETADRMQFRNLIHFIDNDIYRSFYSREILKPVVSVYYRRDNLHPFSYWKKHVPRLEPLLIGKSDLVICNSPQLAAFAHRFNPRTFDIGQGVDLSAYDPGQALPIPDKIAPIPGPRVGYIGDITSVRLDANLIYSLAESRPDCSFIMIGREDRVFQEHALHNLLNVHFLGSIPRHAVPIYMAALDVCLNPQLLNEVTIGNYPRKVDEYLALGKPVIATRTETMELFRDHVYLCSTVEEYQLALAKALSPADSGQAEARIAFARSHSWENNVQRIYDLLDPILK